VLVRAGDELPALPGVESVTAHNGDLKLTLAPGATPQETLKALLARDVVLEKFEIAIPTLDEIFIRVVEGEV
jgi:ABC-2 type transport system ATP-binding protein